MILILFVVTDAKTLDTGNNANSEDKRRFSSKTKFIAGIVVLSIVCAIVVIVTGAALMTDDQKRGKGKDEKGDSGEN